VDNHEQNKKVELQAGLALVGGHYDWKTNPPISETREAVLTDPVRIARGGDWWTASEPRLLSALNRAGENFLDSLKLKKYGRDSKEEEQRQYHVKDKAARDEEDSESYLPEPHTNIHAWLKELAAKVNMNLPTRAPWFSALRSYVGKFTPDTLANELDQNTLGALVRMICTEGESEGAA
jgi:hypothetical protein